MNDKIIKMHKENPEYFRYLAYELGNLVLEYGKYRVLWAIEQMEKKYDIRQ